MDVFGVGSGSLGPSDIATHAQNGANPKKKEAKNSAIPSTQKPSGGKAYSAEQIRQKWKNGVAQKAARPPIEDPSSLPMVENLKNNPRDPSTLHKLKKMLSEGGLNFSEQEKSVLEKIIP